MPGHVRAACDGRDSVPWQLRVRAGAEGTQPRPLCPVPVGLQGHQAQPGAGQWWQGTLSCSEPSGPSWPLQHSPRAPSSPDPSWAASDLPIFWFALMFPQFLEKPPGVPSTRGPLPCSQLWADLGHSDSHWVSTNAHPIKEALDRTSGSIMAPVRNTLPWSGALGALSC